MTAGRRDDLEAARAPAPGQDPEAGEEDPGLAARRRVALGPGPETVWREKKKRSPDPEANRGPRAARSPAPPRWRRRKVGLDPGPGPKPEIERWSHDPDPPSLAPEAAAGLLSRDWGQYSGFKKNENSLCGIKNSYVCSYWFYLQAIAQQSQQPSRYYNW